MDPAPDALPLLGIAGLPATDAEKAIVKQAIFMLRYRMRLAIAAPAVD